MLRQEIRNNEDNSEIENPLIITAEIIFQHLNVTDKNTFYKLHPNTRLFFSRSMSQTKKVYLLSQDVVASDLIKVKKTLDESRQPFHLLNEKIKFHDLSGRPFENFSVFEYALWSKDILMLKLMKQYLSNDEMQELIDSYDARHGDYFNLQDLIRVLETFFNKTFTNSEAEYWVQTVGNTQRELPAHLASIYCDPNQLFTINPEVSFDLALIKRVLTLPNQKSWYDKRLGTEYAVSKGLQDLIITNTGTGDWLAVDINVWKEFDAALNIELAQFKESCKTFKNTIS
jgi:hypothetical protein